MQAFVQRIFGAKSDTGRPARMPRTRRPELKLESLQDRNLMSSYVDWDGSLLIYSSSPQNVTVSTSINPWNYQSYYRVNENGVITSYPMGAVSSGTVKFFGSEQVDSFRNTTSLRTLAYGAGGNDYLEGGVNNDDMQGQGGNDTVIGGDGNDTLSGQDGADSILAGGGNDWLFGDAGNDILAGQEGDDHLWGQAGDDWMFGDNGNDTLEGAAGRDWLNGKSGDDQLWGGDDADSMYGDDGHDTMVGGASNDSLFGGSGYDQLFGEAGSDTLRGEGGGDTLVGGANNDWLYGGDWWDDLHGDDGNDWLDAGSPGELVDGGSGFDLNAWVWTVNEATWTDVRQGGGPTCWLNSAMSSAALRGVDFNTRITYLGNDTYSVGLFNTAGQGTTELVSFSGITLPADALLDPAQEGEFWPLLIQRAYLENRSASIISPPSGNAGDPLAAFTGRASVWVVPNDLTRLRNALAAGLNVVADTRDAADQLSTTMLVPWHEYTVVNAYADSNGQWFMVLRNPWGTDGGGTTWGNPNDGIIEISWNDFTQSMDSFCVN